MIYKKLDIKHSFNIIIVVVILILNVVLRTSSHVSLTFPLSRKFHLDFLNSFWTKPPCGMPKGSIKTSLIAGQAINVTWHLGYAHKGGYRLELLNNREEKIMDLTPVTKDNEFVQGLTTAQAHEVTIPLNLTCKDCTIRLLRQVPEFAAAHFFFWSCSDVDIVPLKNYRETCSNAGSFVRGQCNCFNEYWGNRCQYKDECENDRDCNVGGKCVYLDGSALPTKQCFCSPNYFGEKCSRLNPSSIAKSPDQLNISKHIKVPLSERMTMLFKTKLGAIEDDDEIEFVLIVNGTSFAGLGWKPTALGPACKNWPFDLTAHQIDPASGIRPIAKRQVTNKQPVAPAAGGESQGAPESQFPPDYPDEPYFILHEWAAHDPFTPMDCTDIVIGTARGNRARVRDYYSRGRHTPQIDESWGGKNDLVGATGWEIDGITTIVFRRRVRTRDGPDHSIKDEMLMIWARGQQPREHIHNPHFQLDKGEAQVSDFYVEDELKYHGLGTNRGVLYINFTAARTEFEKY